MKVRLEPEDEYTHEPSSESNFNESMYFNVYDPGSGVGAFFRIGNRMNEGMAEVTACVYLPDGRVAFTFGRTPISSTPCSPSRACTSGRSSTPPASTGWERRAST